MAGADVEDPAEGSTLGVVGGVGGGAGSADWGPEAVVGAGGVGSLTGALDCAGGAAADGGEAARSGAGAATSGVGGAGGVGAATSGVAGVAGPATFVAGSGTLGAPPPTGACATATEVHNASSTLSANASEPNNRPAVAHEARLGVGAIDRAALSALGGEPHWSRA